MRVAHAFLLVVLLAALVIGVWCFAFRLPVVDVITPSRGDAAEVVYATGVVEPRIWAKVTPLIRERIVELCNCEGAPVERGAALARLDDREAQAVLAELQARLRLASEELARLTALAGRNVASAQAVSEARSEVARLGRWSPARPRDSRATSLRRRCEALFCARTAKSARSPSRATSCRGSASRSHCWSSPRSTRRIFRGSSSANALCSMLTPTPIAASRRWSTASRRRAIR